jgi:hypothetical protein
MEVRCGQLSPALNVDGRLADERVSVRSGLLEVGSTRVTSAPPAVERRAIQYGVPLARLVVVIDTMFHASLRSAEAVP